MYIPFGIDLVVRLLAFTKDAHSVICFTSATWTGAIALAPESLVTSEGESSEAYLRFLETTSIASLADPLSNAAVERRRRLQWRGHHASADARRCLDISRKNSTRTD